MILKARLAQLLRHREEEKKHEQELLELQTLIENTIDTFQGTLNENLKKQAEVIRNLVELTARRQRPYYGDEERIYKEYTSEEEREKQSEEEKKKALERIEQILQFHYETTGKHELEEIRKMIDYLDHLMKEHENVSDQACRELKKARKKMNMILANSQTKKEERKKARKQESKKEKKK